MISNKEYTLKKYTDWLIKSGNLPLDANVLPKMYLSQMKSSPIEVVCDMLSITQKELLSKTRKERYVFGRQLIMWYSRIYLGFTWHECGNIVNLDHF